MPAEQWNTSMEAGPHIYINAGDTNSVIYHLNPKMSAPSSPCSGYSTLSTEFEFEADPKVVKMLVIILTRRHGILHYHSQTGELATFQWWITCFMKKCSLLTCIPCYRPTNRYGEKIHPCQFQAYHEMHVFRYPCCLCAMDGRYVETSIFPHHAGICEGEYVTECATSTCGYMHKYAYLHNDIGYLPPFN